MTQLAAESLQVQQLLELLAVTTSVSDEQTAVQRAVERAAQALEAEVSAVMFDGQVAAAVGFPTGAVPASDLWAVANGDRDWIDVPGLDRCRAFAAAWAGTRPGHLIIARWGDDHFTAAERSLVRGMARLLELSLTMVRTLHAEQDMRERSERQARENALLAESLREQQRLMRHVSDVQRAISRRDPLQQILEMITSAAADLLGDEIVGLWVRDPEAPDRARLLSALGLPATQLPALPLTEVGAVGTAMRIDGVATASGYDGTSRVIHELTGGRLRASMAAPVRESGEVVGGLLVASYSDKRVYSARDRQTLGAFAENVSLALTDAHTLDRVNRAVHDTLTGLASRGLFLDRLRSHLAQGQPAALLFIDLDGFKPVNDALGHAAGDELLVGVAARIRSLLRGPDVAGRLGGDEFAVMLAGAATPADAVAVAERLVFEIACPVTLAGGAVSVGASVGIALSAGSTDPADLLHRADIAMYHAKRSGRGRYVIFTPDMLTEGNSLAW